MKRRRNASGKRPRTSETSDAKVVAPAPVQASNLFEKGKVQRAAVAARKATNPREKERTKPRDATKPREPAVAVMTLLARL